MKIKSKHVRFQRKANGPDLTLRLLLWLLVWQEGYSLPKDCFLKDDRTYSYEVLQGHGTESAILDCRISITDWPATCVQKNGNKLFTGQSNKLRNKERRSEHGNGKMRNNIKILHWNMGPKFWNNKKEEIEAVILEHFPDLLIISEANLLLSLNDQERGIPG